MTLPGRSLAVQLVRDWPNLLTEAPVPASQASHVPCGRAWPRPASSWPGVARTPGSWRSPGGRCVCPRLSRAPAVAFPDRCPQCQLGWSTHPLAEARDPHPPFGEQGYVVTIYCEQMHSWERKLTEAELEVLHEAMEVPDGPQRSGRANAGESKNRSDNDAAKWLSVADVDLRWVYEWARDSLPGIPISPTEEERELLSMGYRHLPPRFRPTDDAAMEVRWNEEDGFEVLNHLSSTITDCRSHPALVLVRDAHSAAPRQGQSRMGFVPRWQDTADANRS